MIGRIIGLILVGLIIGALGRLVHPGRDPMPIWLTVVIGIAAALIAGLIIGGLLGFILAVVIAAVLVAVVGGMYRGRTAV
ncbi:MAG: GlsB/YeaQ/YmgE family stress response membrane protein [Thermoleophilia bacterium]|nr:GlsB/YeaQ/YmgE family stress response membrane protein [Thermoleophilia bacterium]